LELYEAEGQNTKFIPVVFCADDARQIPVELRGATRYDLSTSDAYDNLLRQLTNQPARKASAVASQIRAMPPGPQTAMPPLPRKQQFSGPLWNVPIPRNPFFTGRKKVLDEIESGLQSRGLVALTGIGGVGKTQTAAHFAHEHRADYTAVLWASAVSEATLVSDFAAIAGLLNLPEQDAKDQTVAVAAVKGWLESNTGWLLVIDNADDLKMARGFIPQDAKGHILLTTRARAVGGLAERVEIEEMEPKEGALFLLRRAGVITRDAQLDAASEAHQKLAQRISEELGGLPLALDQAGAFIDETPSSLREYLELYKAEGARLRAERGDLGDHPSVTVTFSLAFQKVAESSASAADLVRLCAFLAPDSIPEEIFTEGAAELGKTLSPVAADKLEFAKALEEAGRFSLIDRDPLNRTIDIHRLVQAVVKDGMPENEKRQWSERAVRAVNDAFPRPEFANWAQCERLVSQALACASPVEAYEFEFKEAAGLLNEAGYYLRQRARFSDVGPLYQRALAIWEKALGPQHPNVATGLSNLATLYRLQGKYAEAEPLYQRALAIDEKALGPDDPEVATDLNNLAGLYRAQGKYAQAEPLYKRALAIDEKALGPDHPGVATDLNNLAVLYDNQGKHGQAEPLYQRALTIAEKAQGPDHPDVAVSLNNLAELYRAQGRYADAEPLHQRALAIREKALGPDHPDLASSLNNLGLHYKVQGKYAQAEPLYQRALAIWEKALGPEHPSVVTVLGNYALLLREMKRGAAARELEVRARRIRAAHAENNPPK